MNRNMFVCMVILVLSGWALGLTTANWLIGPQEPQECVEVEILYAKR